MSEPRAKFALLPKIINGGIAGIIGVSVVYPLDLVKTRWQNQQINARGEPQYKSILDCFRKTLKAEGYFGMYRGSLVNIIFITPEKVIKLTANDFFRYHLTTSGNVITIPNQMLAGGLAGLCQIIITTPMELLKIQLQDEGRVAAQRSGIIQRRTSATEIALNLLRTNGIFGLYRGMGATALRDVSFSVIFFPLFAYLNSLGPRRNDGSGEAVFWCSFLAGCAAGSVASVSVTPLDVVKTRLQLITKGEGEIAYNGIIDAFVGTFRNEGIKALFKGACIRMFVIAPLFGIAQTVYYLGIGEKLLSMKIFG